MARRQPINTRQGGHRKDAKLRQIVANPEGSREERRAAKKLRGEFKRRPDPVPKED